MVLNQSVFFLFPSLCAWPLAARDQADFAQQQRAAPWLLQRALAGEADGTVAQGHLLDVAQAGGRVGTNRTYYVSHSVFASALSTQTRHKSGEFHGCFFFWEQVDGKEKSLVHCSMWEWRKAGF